MPTRSTNQSFLKLTSQHNVKPEAIYEVGGRPAACLPGAARRGGCCSGGAAAKQHRWIISYHPRGLTSQRS
jgi:hypothetical protein